MSLSFPEILEFMQKLTAPILALVNVAEAAFSDTPKSGEQKKAMVMTAVKCIVEGGAIVATGGAATSWAVYAPVVGYAIDIAAGQLFPTDKQ